MISQSPLPGLRIFENFIPQNLHDEFLKQMRLGTPEANNGHYDAYSFADYEAFDQAFFPLVEYTINELKKLQIFKAGIDKKIQLGCSLVGYKKNGFIKKHTDSALLSGDTVVVLSFGSPVVIHFYSEKAKLPSQQFFIPPRSLYIMADEIRHDWSHEIKPNECIYQGKTFKRGDRYSLLLFEPGSLYQGELLGY